MKLRFFSNTAGKYLFVFFVSIAMAFTTQPILAQMGGGAGGMGRGGGMGNGSGMMSGFNSFTMGNGMGGMMLLSGSQPYRTDGKLLQMDDAVAIAQKYLTSRKETNLSLDEVEEWEYNFYAVVKETDSSNKAFQLIIDKLTGVVMPEPGPNMMWSQKYMNGGMGRSEAMGFSTRGPATMTVTADAATATANQFLSDRFGPARRLAVVTPGDTFYGYYNFDVNDVATGKKYGMLSVNGVTGQVWYHTWHGNFIQGREI